MLEAAVISKALTDLVCLVCWTEHSCSELCTFVEDIEAAAIGNLHNACIADDRWATAAVVATQCVVSLVVTAAELFTISSICVYSIWQIAKELIWAHIHFPI